MDFAIARPLRFKLFAPVVGQIYRSPRAGATQVTCVYCSTTVFVEPPKRATGVYAPPPTGQPTIRVDEHQWVALGGAIAKGTMWFTFAIFAVVGLFVLGIMGFVFWQINHGIQSANDTMKSAQERQEEANNEPVVKTLKKQKEKKTRSSGDPLRTEGPSYNFPSLDGCTCKVKVDGQQGFATLAAKVAGPNDSELSGSFELSGPGGHTMKLAVTDKTGPQRSIQGSMLGLAMTCSEDVVAIASGKFMSGWSLKSEKVLWSTELPGAYIFPGKDPKTDFTIRCGHAEGTNVTLSTEKGDVTIRIKDGIVLKK